MLNIDVVTVRTLRGVDTEDGGHDEAPGAAVEPALAVPAGDGARLAEAWKEAGEGVGCGTDTGSTRTLSRPT